MKKFVFFLLFVGLTSSNVYCKETCRRPSWHVVYNNELGCSMYYNHFILWETEISKKPTIERKNGFCYVKKGFWHVQSFNRKVDITESKDINIDHILPYNYIVKQVGCEKAKKYFNERYNLEPVEARYNKSKSDKTCTDKNICSNQKMLCNYMENLYKENLNCDKLRVSVADNT